MGLLARYTSGLCVAVIGLCASGWLVLAPVAFGYRGSAPHRTALTDRATGGGLAVVSLLTLIFWAIAWRRKLRADGVLPRMSRRRARREERDMRRRAAAGQAEIAPDPAQVLSELRALLLPLLAESPAAPAPAPAVPEPGGPESAGPAEPAGALPEPEPVPATAAEPVVVPELHHHGAVPEPRSELEPFRLPEGAPEATEPDHGETAEAAAGQPAAAAVPGGPDSYPFAGALVPVPAVPLDQLTPPAPSGIAAIESMLAGAELSMVGCGEEETW
jgi:hypothetical protein